MHFDPLPAVKSELDGIIREEGKNDPKGMLPGKVLLNAEFTKAACGAERTINGMQRSVAKTGSNATVRRSVIPRNGRISALGDNLR